MISYFLVGNIAHGEDDDCLMLSKRLSNVCTHHIQTHWNYYLALVVVIRLRN